MVGLHAPFPASCFHRNSRGAPAKARRSANPQSLANRRRRLLVHLPPPAGDSRPLSTTPASPSPPARRLPLPPAPAAPQPDRRAPRRSEAAAAARRTAAGEIVIAAAARGRLLSPQAGPLCGDSMRSPVSPTASRSPIAKAADRIGTPWRRAVVRLLVGERAASPTSPSRHGHSYHSSQIRDLTASWSVLTGKPGWDWQPARRSRSSRRR